MSGRHVVLTCAGLGRAILTRSVSGWYEPVWSAHCRRVLVGAWLVSCWAGWSDMGRLLDWWDSMGACLCVTSRRCGELWCWSPKNYLFWYVLVWTCHTACVAFIVFLWGRPGDIVDPVCVQQALDKLILCSPCLSPTYADGRRGAFFSIATMACGAWIFAHIHAYMHAHIPAVTLSSHWSIMESSPNYHRTIMQL